jgi:hypothetical protein
MTPGAGTIAIEAIKVGERHRRDLGDIEGLAASIAEVGLLQPIALTFDGYLIAGERRLRAAQVLGWRAIPYTLIPLNLDQIVRGEFAENAVRKDFTLSEAVAIKRALEPLERARAKERMLAGKPSENFFRGWQRPRQDCCRCRQAPHDHCQGRGRCRRRRGRAGKVRQAERRHGSYRTRERSLQTTTGRHQV